MEHSKNGGGGRPGGVGKTVGQIMEEAGLEFGDLELIDEPPGKLRQVAYTATGEGEPRRIVLLLRYDSSLFSPEREWARDLVRAAVVTADETDAAGW